MRAFVMTCVFVLVLVMVGCQSESAPKPPAAQPQEAASNAIGVLQKLVTAENYRSFGFESADEVKEAQLGQPLPVSTIGLDKLKSSQSGAEPNSLLATSPETIYPVIVRGNVRSGVTIVHKAAGYEPASFGNAEIVKALSRYRQGQSGNEFVVRIPAFNMYYLARRVENQLILVPIVDDPRLKVKAGEAVPLQRLLVELRPLVDAYNGLPM
jgi:hypothetical protein